ncbi:sulfite exporter TauE/SafE family protein [Neptunicella sp. SCSIO 80796]|uniref:sulfite exporter TauE/SafE family protein n=1 Tax=Neptunicella plasticusilytica TaxID=3117012 RepID=UPI003A4D3621
MNDISLLSALLVGIAGSVHCVGMCGGIVGALTFAIPARANPVPYMLAYNLGRISSYTLAGALTGYLGKLFSHQVHQGLVWLQLLSGAFLLLLACYIGGWWKVLSQLEKLGGYFWRRISPLSKRFIPFSSPAAALPYGLIWGWLPCGLVYSTLVWSLASGSAVDGALTMLFFGLGTLPALLILGALGTQLKQYLSLAVTRQIMAVMLLGFSFYILLTAL